LAAITGINTELYEAAKAAGVEIAFDAKKAEIIDAVIVQDKAAALLK
jgi:ABC-type polysaccharide transport system permease subunit